MPDYVPPDREHSAFHCPFCRAYSAMTWGGAYEGRYYNVKNKKVAPTAAVHDGMSIAQQQAIVAGLDYAQCTHCGGRTIWYLNKLVHPLIVEFGPPPLAETPSNVKRDYDEARSIGTLSARGAAALLRLAIQKLCSHLGEDASNLNAAIGSLVKKGMPVEVQEALDIVRVVGNNAVHPGEMNVEDTPEIALRLFDLINYIVDQTIVQPTKRKALFGILPEGAKRGIEGRDAQK